MTTRFVAPDAQVRATFPRIGIPVDPGDLDYASGLTASLAAVAHDYGMHLKGAINAQETLRDAEEKLARVKDPIIQQIMADPQHKNKEAREAAIESQWRKDSRCVAAQMAVDRARLNLTEERAQSDMLDRNRRDLRAELQYATAWLQWAAAHDAEPAEQAGPQPLVTVDDVCRKHGHHWAWSDLALAEACDRCGEIKEGYE